MMTLWLYQPQLSMSVKKYFSSLIEIGIQCDFPPLKLKAGCGEQVVSILDQLAWKALKRKNFGFKKPKYEEVK